MLTLEHLTLGYGKKEILKDVSVSFPEGCVTAITGASGIGKTTLLQAVAGLLRPLSGKILSDYRRISYVFQEPRLFLWMTALENVCAVCSDRDRARELLERLVPDSAGLYPHELSGGMKQRVSIARALAYETELLLMDEPFKGLDPQTKRSVADLVFESTRGKTVLLITHDREDLRFCDASLAMIGSPVTALHLEKIEKKQIGEFE